MGVLFSVAELTWGYKSDLTVLQRTRKASACIIGFLSYKESIGMGTHFLILPGGVEEGKAYYSWNSRRIP